MSEETPFKNGSLPTPSSRNFSVGLTVLVLTISLLRRSSNNLNQIAKRVNETSRIYAADIECLLENQEKLWYAAKEILGRLANLR